MNVAEKDVIVAEDDHEDLYFFKIAIQETATPVALVIAKRWKCREKSWLRL